MSNKRKHPVSASDAHASVRSESSAAASSSSSVISRSVFSRRVLFQLAMIVGLSCVLGFAFNASSPVGVKFEKPFVASVVSEIVVKPAGTPTPVAQPESDTYPPMPSTAAEEHPVAAVVAEAVPASPPRAQSEAPSDAPFAAPWPAQIPLPAAADNTAPQIPAAPATQANPSVTHWPETKALLAEGRAVLVDVRHKAMFDAGHIPGAMSLPETSAPEEYSTFLASQPKETIIIVYCSSTSCSQSERVAKKLVNEFHRADVRYMTGGYMEYQQMELAKPAQ